MKHIKANVASEDVRKFIQPNQTVGSVSIEKDLQKTLPSLALTKAFPRADLGDSGTRILHGIITEEYNPNLQGIQGIQIYDQMRKSDGTVQGGLHACKLPIRRAEWFIRDAGDSPAAQEQAEFIRHALFDWIEGMTFDDILRQALLMLDFGVMLFEKIYGTYEFEGKTYVTLKKLAPRLPKSVLMWELTDRTFGIQQIRQDGVLAQIPGSKMLIFVNELEGDNWWGTSLLRGAYQHWYHKNNYYNIDGIGFERQAVGVPFAEMPVGYTQADEAKAETVLSNLRAGESQFVVYPNTIKIGFLDMGGKAVRDPQNAIDHHNKEILQSMLAQFLELGQGTKSRGSRSLSQDHSDLFLKAMEAVANQFLSVMNRELIRELIDLNFDKVEAYPVLDYNGIAKTDIAGVGASYAALVTAGGITPTKDDQQYLRALMGLPPRSQEDIDKESDDEPDEETLEHPGPTEDDVDDATEDMEDADVATKNTPAPKKTTSQPQKPEKPVPPLKNNEHAGEVLKRTFAVGKGFSSWRPLTMSETKVDWAGMQDRMDAIEKEIADKGSVVMQKAKDEFMAKAHEAIQTGNYAAVNDASLNFEHQYKQVLVDAMVSAHAYGRRSATNEMGQGDGRPAISDSELAAITIIAGAAAAKAAADIEARAKIAVADAMKSGKPHLQAAGDVDRALDKTIQKTVTDDGTTLVGQSVNDGRGQVFGMNNIYALQRSEILDKRTCNFCISMDGRIVDPKDGWGGAGIFHSNCRGIWVAILNEETNKPDIDGVPGNVADHYGGSVNDLVQPRAPITKEGSLADQFVKREQLKKK